MKQCANGKKHIWFLGIVIPVYRLLSDWIYLNIIYRNFGYEGYVNKSKGELVLISWVIFLLSIICMKSILDNNSEKVSAIVITILYFISFVPFTTCIAFGLLDNGYVLLNCVYWVLLIVFESYYIRKKEYKRWVIRIGNYKINDKFVNFIGIISFLLVVFISAKYTHFRLNFNMFAVYDLRREAVGYGMPTLVAYMFDWSKAINPIMMGYCLIKKKYPMAIIYFASQMLSFGIDGLKSTFFLPFVVIFSYVFMAGVSFVKLKSLIAYCFAGISLLGILEYITFKSYFVVQFFIRRMEFTTNYISNCYYEFFSTHTPDYFRASFLRYLGLESPYTKGGKSIGEVIADEFGRKGVNFNNGLFADAITNGGIIGVFVMPFIVAFVLRLIDKSTYGLDVRLILTIAFYTTLTLLSSFLPTALLTHGLIIMIFLLYYIDRNEMNGNSERYIK